MHALDFLIMRKRVPGATSDEEFTAQAIDTHGGVSRATIGKFPRIGGEFRRALKGSRRRGA